MYGVIGGRPGDLRGFIHKRLIGAASGFLKGGPLAAISGFVSGGGSNAQRNAMAAQRAQLRAAQRAEAARFTPAPQRAFDVPLLEQRAIPFKTSGCPSGYTKSRGQCVPTFGGDVRKPGPKAFLQELIPGGETGLEVFGNAVMGRYGAALEPAVAAVTVRDCPKGAVLGNDGLCYNKDAIKNSQREWPRGRRPLLTGGDMRAISIASRAANKLQRKQKQLQELGLLKKPAARKQQKQIGPGHHAHVAHD